MEAIINLKSELSDEILCQQAVSGDRLAEEVLVTRYMRLARACARPYFLAGLLKAIREFDQSRDASFRTFAEICMRNRIRSAVTAAARDKHAPLNYSVSMEQSVSEKDHERDPEELFISREEEAERLAALKQKLSPLERQILTLYLHGYSYREIGAHVGRTDKSVDNAVQRIRHKVAVQLGDFSES